MACRGLYVFSHQSSLGNAPAHSLIERIAIQRKDGVKVPRHFSDYHVEVDESDLPSKVTLTRLVG